MAQSSETNWPRIARRIRSMIKNRYIEPSDWSDEDVGSFLRELFRKEFPAVHFGSIGQKEQTRWLASVAERVAEYLDLEPLPPG